LEQDGIGSPGDVMLDHKFIEKIREYGGKKALAEIVELYFADQVLLLGHIREALAANDSARLQDRAHALKGCSINLGAVEIGSLCEKIERLSAAGELREAAPLVDQLEFEASAVRHELQLELSK
jgi:histidine phosphotransfer protein HptB